METQNTSHLVALMKQLAALRKMARSPLVDVWIAQKQREIAGECKFLGIADVSAPVADISDDDLFAELS